MFLGKASAFAEAASGACDLILALLEFSARGICLGPLSWYYRESLAMLFPAGSRVPFSADQACKQQNGLLSAAQTMPPARDATWLPKVPDAKVMEA